MAGGQPVEIGKGQIVTSLTQPASKFELFSEDGGEPLKQETDTIILSSKVISQVAMNRLAGTEVTGDLGFGSLQGDSLLHGAIPEFLKVLGTL